MQTKDDVKIKGAIILTVKHKNGSVETRRKDNLILTAGFNFICDAIANPQRPALMGFTAVGTGTTAVAASQTGLVSELLRKEATYTHSTNSKVFTLTTTFNAGEATGAITEAGICNAESGGTFLDRVNFAVINKAEDDTMTTTFQFALS